MVKRLINTEMAFAFLPTTIQFERNRLKVDTSYNLPEGVQDTVGDVHLWVSLKEAHVAIDPICKAQGLCESDSASMSTSMAALIYVRVQIKTANGLEDSKKKALGKDLVRNAQRYLCNVQNLALI